MIPSGINEAGLRNALRRTESPVRSLESSRPVRSSPERSLVLSWEKSEVGWEKLESRKNLSCPAKSFEFPRERSQLPWEKHELL